MSSLISVSVQSVSMHVSFTPYWHACRGLSPSRALIEEARAATTADECTALIEYVLPVDPLSPIALHRYPSLARRFHRSLA